MSLHYYSESWIAKDDSTIEADICVYGGTAAGVAAGVAATELGKRAVLLHPGYYLGGMTTGGLGYTDLGNKAAIGGLARRFYRWVGEAYAGAGETGEESWKFEPSVASSVLTRMIGSSGLDVRVGCYLESLERAADGRIASLTMRGGLRVRAAQYIDATYEGDLMAAAGVPYTVGRESNTAYGETLNGFQMHETHQFRKPVSPYREPDSPASGLLPGFREARFLTTAEARAFTGRGDHRLQAYNFRVCMSNDPARSIPFPRPERYDPADYELAARWIDSLEDHREVFRKFDLVTASKTDTNNHGGFSTDYIGGSWEWPTAGYERREELFQDHVRYQQGLHYFLANDPRVRDEVRAEYGAWGLAADEFRANGGWPHQLYIREGRRMVADYVVTEDDCMGRRTAEDPVGMGAYNMDSHNCERIVVDGFVRNEGDVQQPLPRPYGVSARSILPPKGTCPNLTVPVALSASHIAFGSVRMEPVFMILSESASVIAAMAMDSGGSVQDVPYAELSPVLERRGLVLRTGVRNRTGSVNPDS